MEVDDIGNSMSLGGTQDAIVNNNTLIQNTTNATSKIQALFSHGPGVSGITPGGTGLVFRNNIMAADSSVYVFQNKVGSIINDIDNNLYFNIDSDINAKKPFDEVSTDTSFAQWQALASTSGLRDTNSISSDPNFISSSNFNLQSTSPAIDAGTHIDGITQNCSGTCVDYAGNPIYGLPDIGAYEYQPTLEMGDDEVSTSAPIRMYGDEKFRNKEAPADGTTADLDITIPDSDKSEWLDIEITAWGDTKTWTESTTESITDIEHSIGGLTANTNYEVSVDNVLGQDITGSNCISGVCTANTSGEITFTYTGTYSNHTFQVVQQEEEEEEEHDELEIDDVKYESTATTITIKWDTNNDADSKVKYGTQDGHLDE